MGNNNTPHRELMSGLRIVSMNRVNGRHSEISAGTLTGVATRGNQQFLVTNQHVIAGTETTHPQRTGERRRIRYRQAHGREEMFQGFRKVGDTPTTVLSSAVDVGMVELKNTAAHPRLHDASHSARYIARGAIEPTLDMDDLVFIGQATGEKRVKVTAIGAPFSVGGVQDFTGLIELQTLDGTNIADEGDSGAPIFYKLREGVYQLVAIFFAAYGEGNDRNWRVAEQNKHIGYAFRATLAESALTVTFGKRPPKVSSSPITVTKSSVLPGAITPGQTVTLDATGITDPDDDPLSYRWTTDEDNAAGVTLLNDRSKAAQFLAPAAPANMTFFVVATNVIGDVVTAAVRVEVEKATRTRVQPPAPKEPPDTVTDTAPIQIPPGTTVWSKWIRREGEYCGEGENRKCLEMRTSDDLSLEPEYQWVDCPEPVDNGDDDDDDQSDDDQNGPDNQNGDDNDDDDDDDDKDTIPPDDDDGNGDHQPVVTQWEPTGQYRYTGADRQREESRTVDGVAEYRWIDDPDETNPRNPVPPQPPAPPWSSWSRTGNTRGSGRNREAEEERTRGSERETQWVADPEPETWGDWSDSGKYRHSGLNREKEQTRTSSWGNNQSRWVRDPEEVWGNWSRTGRTRYSGADREAEERRRSNLRNTQTRWVSDPDTETWSSWTRTGKQRFNGVEMEYEETRTSSLGRTQTRWVPD